MNGHRERERHSVVVLIAKHTRMKFNMTTEEGVTYRHMIETFVKEVLLFNIGLGVINTFRSSVEKGRHMNDVFKFVLLE